VGIARAQGRRECMNGDGGKVNSDDAFLLNSHHSPYS
jgi:hypothetical protein